MGNVPGHDDVRKHPDARARDAGQLDQYRQPERPAAQLTEAETLAAAREKAHNAADAAERAWYEYASRLEVGNDRTRAFAVYENLRCARRL